MLFNPNLLWLQILDLAVSLAKVADVDRSLHNEDVAVGKFQEAIKLLVFNIETWRKFSSAAGNVFRVKYLGLFVYAYVRSGFIQN